MEKNEDQRSPVEKEKDQVKSDIKSYVKGLEYSLRLGGKLPEDEEDRLYEEANEAGDRLFGKEREKSGFRTTTYEEEVIARFGSLDKLKAGLEEYKSDLIRFRTEDFSGNPVFEDSLREDTIRLQEKLVGKGIKRIVF